MADSTETRKERRASARVDRDRAAQAARARRRQRLWILGGVLALVTAIVVVIAIASGGDDKPDLKAGEQLPGQFEANARFAGIPQDGITLGDPRAPLTLVEFADLQCPFCRDFARDVLPAIVADYVRSGKVKLVFRNVAFISQDSNTAALMAAAAGRQDKLWEFVDIFYANQGAEGSGYVTDEFLRDVGSAVRGLDVEQAMQDRNLPATQTQINDAHTAWQTAGFTGTPSFLLGPTGGTLEAMLRDNEAPTVALVTERINEALSRQG
jgi:protein-disulfide isomerase